MACLTGTKLPRIANRYIIKYPGLQVDDKTQQVPGFTAVHYWAILNKQIALLLIV
jgi:hypothetical protein